MKDLKVKIILGFRREQQVTIDAGEAPKAYYLFLNPEKRGVFSNGVAIRGVDIQRIEPDYQATMGYNQEHQLDEDDRNEIRAAGVERPLRMMLAQAKEIAQSGDMKLINTPLQLPEPRAQISGLGGQLKDKMAMPTEGRKL